MKIYVGDICKSNLILELYNNALCGGVAYDDEPAARRLAEILGAAKGRAARAFELIDVEAKAIEYIDLGVGPRVLKLRFDGAIKDAKYIYTAEYDKLHGQGAGKGVVDDMKKAIDDSLDELDAVTPIFIRILQKRLSKEGSADSPPKTKKSHLSSC